MGAALTLAEIIAAAKRLSPAQQRELLRAINDDVERDEADVAGVANIPAPDSMPPGFDRFLARAGSAVGDSPELSSDK